MKILTEKLRQYLKERNISHSEFAEILGVNDSDLTKILNEDSQLDYETAKKFVYKLGAYEANKFIDWEGMHIEQPAI